MLGWWRRVTIGWGRPTAAPARVEAHGSTTDLRQAAEGHRGFVKRTYRLQVRTGQVLIMTRVWDLLAASGAWIRLTVLLLLPSWRSL